ncbi:uncharacterized protein LOC129317220 [Prosopis cineraria]|uniref:uncharacterized protein LOC129317220 n=1 Tax=Prosopis cineraria TaxID=364024 RepID=UPI0024100D5E|nr:uncharacterized protein LOC129317220 [Prosopis cineraria]
MADCEAPSFSLGLDLDHNVDESNSRSPLSLPRASAHVEDKECFGPDVVESDPDMAPDPPPRILKRLRRGPGDGSPPPIQRQEGLRSGCDGDDDIEEFSDEEDLQFQARPPTWNQPLCSSSKISLNGSGVLTTHSSGNRKERKMKKTSGILGSATLEMGQSGLMFPKLTASPLRKFQLLDSDSDDDDDDPVSEDVSGGRKVDPCFKEPSCKPNEFVTSFDRKASFQMHQSEDLWKDFSPVKSFSIPTPALNEVCEEYFRSAKDKEKETSVSAIHYESLFESTSCQRDEQIWNSAYPLPPAHQYFFHKDPRIRKLVRSRLFNFYPLGVDKVNHQPNASHIDYMGQFNNEGSKKKEACNGYLEKSSTRGRTKPKEVTVEEPFHASGGWVAPKINSSFGGESSERKATKKSNAKTMSKGKSKANLPNSSEILHASANWVEPQNCANMPKDASRRRVQANSKSVGHWFTGSGGRKVYVAKDGQELTGRAAYRHYRRESGSGFKKSKRKPVARRKLPESWCKGVGSVWLSHVLLYVTQISWHVWSCKSPVAGKDGPRPLIV